MVELIECLLCSFKRLGIMEITSYEVTEFKESMHTSNHLNWNKTLNGRQKYLHEGFRIVTCPLFKAPPLRKAAEARKRSHDSDAVLVLLD